MYVYERICGFSLFTIFPGIFFTLLLQVCGRVVLVIPVVSYSKAAVLWQQGTGGAQHGLLLALDQGPDLGPDLTSTAAASLMLIICFTARPAICRLSVVGSSRQGRGGGVNLTDTCDIVVTTKQTTTVILLPQNKRSLLKVEIAIDPL